jgi:hypothetical protein
MPSDPPCDDSQSAGRWFESTRRLQNDSTTCDERPKTGGTRSYRIATRRERIVAQLCGLTESKWRWGLLPRVVRRRGPIRALFVPHTTAPVTRQPVGKCWDRAGGRSGRARDPLGHVRLRDPACHPIRPTGVQVGLEITRIDAPEPPPDANRRQRLRADQPPHELLTHVQPVRDLKDLQERGRQIRHAPVWAATSCRAGGR